MSNILIKKSETLGVLEENHSTLDPDKKKTELITGGGNNERELKNPEITEPSNETGNKRKNSRNYKKQEPEDRLKTWLKIHV